MERDGGSSYDRPAPVFVGFRDGQTPWVGALYEFWTASGQYVYLHEMTCVDMSYQPLSRRLVLTFECVASDLMPPSVVVLSFDDAEIYQWETDFSGTEWTASEPRVRGQVSGLDCWGDPPDSGNLGVSFHLGLFDVTVSLFASTVTCEMTHGPWRPGNAPL
jgi:hypothetical protein